MVAAGPEETVDIPLPIAGLMAPLSGSEMACLTLRIHEMAKRIGCPMKSPFIAMAFMCLPVIPDIKITDRHLVDTRNMRIIKDLAPSC